MFIENIIFGSLLGLGFGLFMFFMFVIALIVFIAMYLFKAYALFTIAKKLKYKYAYIAWIPIIQFFIYPVLAKKKWGWGMIPLLLIILPILFTPFAIVPFVNIFLALLIFIGVILLVIFRTYWLWRIFERRDYHGALSLLTLINIGFLIVIGFVAWKDNKK